MVNRRILKKQLEDIISGLPRELKAAIRIKLYQEIERQICHPQYDEINKESSNRKYRFSLPEKYSSKYDCVVCDECHYFLMDSNYNTNTIFSFRLIQEAFKDKTCIFMSATIHDLQDYVEKNNWRVVDVDDDIYVDTETYYYKIRRNYVLRFASLAGIIRGAKGGEAGKKLERFMRRSARLYKIDRDYSYIDAGNIEIIKNKNDIADIVVKGNGKWLIFVDNIKYGKELEKAISENFRKLAKEESVEDIDSKVRMISSGYKRDYNSDKEVECIINTSVPSAKVLIVTSVLDNGVNIKDIHLRNIILFADTETEFIQMLGRKRKDAQQLKLYIYRYDKNHFENRKRQLKRIKEIADKYLEYIENKIDSQKEQYEMEYQKEEVDLKEIEYRNCQREKECINFLHIKMMQELSDKYIKYEDVSSVFTVYEGRWYLNLLSLQNIENLFRYYDGIIKKFETEGEDAFVKEQLRWLGKTEEEAEKIIIGSRDSREDKSREKVIEALKGIDGTQMSIDEFQQFTNGIRGDLNVLVEKPVDFPEEEQRTEEQDKKWRTITGEFKKSGKPISKQSMEFLCAYCRIPFQVENDRKGGYTVKPVETNEDNMCSDNKK